MVQIAKAEKTQLLIAEERDILCTVSSAAAKVITLSSPTTMIADIYIGCYAQVKACAGNAALNGKEYMITDNAAGTITIDTDISGDLASADTIWIKSYGAAPVGTTVKAAIDQWIGGVMNEGVDLPEPEYDVKRYRTVGGGRDWSLAADGKVTCTGSIPLVLQHGKILKFILGNIYETGTADGTGASDLDGAAEAGDITVTLTSVTGYLVGEYIQIDTSTASEVRKITAINSNTLTLDRSLDRDHADAIACAEVTFPITHVIEGADRQPTFSIEGVFELDSDLIIYYLANAISKADFSGEEEGELKLKVDLLTSRPFKNTGGTKNTVTIPSTKPFMFNQGVFTFFGSIIGRVRKWALEVDLGVEGDVYWNAHDMAAFLSELVEKNRDFKLLTTVRIVDSTIWDQVQARGSLTCQIDFTRGASDTLQMLFSNCEFPHGKHKIPAEGAIEVEMELIPKTVKFTVVDSVPPY